MNRRGFLMASAGAALLSGCKAEPMPATGGFVPAGKWGLIGERGLPFVVTQTQAARMSAANFTKTYPEVFVSYGRNAGKTAAAQRGWSMP